MPSRQFVLYCGIFSGYWFPDDLAGDQMFSPFVAVVLLPTCGPLGQNKKA
jgi:hypothetical protein